MTALIRASMASLLARSEVDLGDERAVIRLLQSAGNNMADIITLSDGATERARELRESMNKLAVS